VAIASTAAPFAGALKPPVGKPVWTAETKYDLLRLDVGAGGKVVFARDGNKLTGLDAATGTVKYERPLPGFDDKAYFGHPEDTTFVYTSGNELFGVDVETGKDRWHASPGEGIKPGGWKGPAAGNPKAMLLAFDSGTSMWDIVQGKVLWSTREPLDDDLLPSAWTRKADLKAGVLMFLPKRTVLVGPDGKELWSAPDSGNERRGGKDILLSAVNSWGRVLLVYMTKQVVLLNCETGEVLASQTFATPEAAADVEAFKLGEEDDDSMLLVTLGGRLVVVDPKEGKVVARTPENSIIGQAARGVPAGTDSLILMTAVRGSGKTPDVGMHLYRIDRASGEVKWHAVNGGTVDNSQVLRNVVGEKINGPYYMEKAEGVLLATDEKGVTLYDWKDGRRRWAVDKSLPNSYQVMSYFGGNSFAVIRSMMQNKVYISTNPPPLEGDGVIYAAKEDEVYAIDAVNGVVRWTSSSKVISLVSGLALEGGTVMVRQGLYRDANDYSDDIYYEEPDVFIEESPYGYVGLDAATGKEQWKCTDFEARESVMEGPMPKDKSICEVAKVEEEKGCKPSHLGIGGILKVMPTAEATMLLGKGGTAGLRPGTCAAAWKVDGSIKKLDAIWNLDTGDKLSGVIRVGNSHTGIVHYGSDVSVIDLAAGQILFAAEKADAVKIAPASKRLYAVEGNNVAMYALP